MQCTRAMPALTAQRPIAARRVAAAPLAVRRRTPLTPGAAAADAASYLADCPPKVGHLTKEERDALAQQFGFRWVWLLVPAAVSGGRPAAGSGRRLRRCHRPGTRAGPLARSCPTM